MKLFKVLSVLVLAVAACLPVKAQKGQDRDSLVVLLSSKSAQMVDVEGASYRKVIGPARFLHNNAYLLCDTALWNVETEIIQAWGKVSIIQNETVLTSDRLTYLINQDLAQFRGSVVQLTDKDHNTLRTRHLDYNTKDSIAVFMNGGAMRDKDGQIIESRTGTYDNRAEKFTFNIDVNMFSDSIFVKTNSLLYESEYSLATFDSHTDVWKEENMLSSDSGWYDRGREIFFFKDKVHLMSEDQEGWCDSLYFYRTTSDIEMLGNAQVTDTTRNVFSLAGRIEYVDSTSKVTLTRDPAVISQTEENDGSIDTVYLGAEKLMYYTLKKCDIDSLAVLDAQKRLDALDVDPVGAFRKKAAEEAAKAAEEAAKNDPNYVNKQKALQNKNNTPKKPAAGKSPLRDKESRPAADSIGMNASPAVRDSIAVSDSLAVTDSLAVQADTVEVLPPKDTTEIGFLEALKNVRIYKKNMQVVCDSLVYSDLDSLARLFKEPIIWQDIRRQYAADSITVVISDGAMEKASLMSNAFITIQEDRTHFDQIKGTEMLAFFDDKGDLTRFDVLGGASALFYIEEKEALATVNKSESKMLSAIFKDGEVQRIYYYEQPKNDGYPIVQMSELDQQLKGFAWSPEKRPADRNAVTPLSLRKSQRRYYAARPKTTFKQTDIYFPGYMSDVYRQMQVRDSLRKVREQDRMIREREAKEKARLDSIATKDSLLNVKKLEIRDSLDRTDSLFRADSLVRSDSLAVNDSLKTVSDSLAVADSMKNVKPLTQEEIKAAKKAEEARKKAEKKAAAAAKKKKAQEEKEARWAELDRIDAEKEKAKAAKRLSEERKRKRKSLAKAAEQARKESELLEYYIDYYQKQKAKEQKD